MLIVPEIPKNRPTELNSLQSYFSKTVGYELRNILNSCYIPKIVKHWKEIEYLTDFNDKHVKEFKKNIDNKYKDFNIISDSKTILLLLIVIGLARLGRRDAARLAFIFLTIKFYSSLMHRFLGQYCVDDYWDAGVQNLSPKHLFKTKNGISNALVYLANEEFDKNYIKFQSDELSDHDVVLITYSIRSRLGQSIRSFVSSVRDAKDKSTNKIGATSGEEELQNISLISEKISMSICTYSQIDTLALSEAIRKSGIIKKTGISIIDNVSSVENKDAVKFLTVLFDRVLPLKNVCIISKQMLIVRKILNGASIGNYTVKDEILNLLYSLENGVFLRSLPPQQLIVFFAHYLTLYIRNRACSQL